MYQTARNLNFIHQKARQGLTVNQIYARCHERMTWDGPLPSVSDIRSIVDQIPAARGAGAARPAGAGTAGLATNQGDRG